MLGQREFLDMCRGAKDPGPVPSSVPCEPLSSVGSVLSFPDVNRAFRDFCANFVRMLESVEFVSGAEKTMTDGCRDRFDVGLDELESVENEAADLVLTIRKFRLALLVERAVSLRRASDPSSESGVSPTKVVGRRAEGETAGDDQQPLSDEREVQPREAEDTADDGREGNSGEDSPPRSGNEDVVETVVEKSIDKEHGTGGQPSESDSFNNEGYSDDDGLPPLVVVEDPLSPEQQLDLDDTSTSSLSSSPSEGIDSGKSSSESMANLRDCDSDRESLLHSLCGKTTAAAFGGSPIASTKPSPPATTLKSSNAGNPNHSFLDMETDDVLIVKTVAGSHRRRSRETGRASVAPAQLMETIELKTVAMALGAVRDKVVEAPPSKPNKAQPMPEEVQRELMLISSSLMSLVPPLQTLDQGIALLLHFCLDTRLPSNIPRESVKSAGGHGVLLPFVFTTSALIGSKLALSSGCWVGEESWDVIAEIAGGSQDAAFWIIRIVALAGYFSRFKGQTNIADGKALLEAVTSRLRDYLWKQRPVEAAGRMTEWCQLMKAVPTPKSVPAIFRFMSEAITDLRMIFFHRRSLDGASFLAAKSETRGKLCRLEKILGTLGLPLPPSIADTVETDRMEESSKISSVTGLLKAVRHKRGSSGGTNKECKLNVTPLLLPKASLTPVCPSSIPAVESIPPDTERSEKSDEAVKAEEVPAQRNGMGDAGNTASQFLDANSLAIARDLAVTMIEHSFPRHLAASRATWQVPVTAQFGPVQDESTSTVFTKTDAPSSAETTNPFKAMRVRPRRRTPYSAPKQPRRDDDVTPPAGWMHLLEVPGAEKLKDLNARVRKRIFTNPESEPDPGDAAVRCEDPRQQAIRVVQQGTGNNQAGRNDQPAPWRLPAAPPLVPCSASDVRGRAACGCPDGRHHCGLQSTAHHSGWPSAPFDVYGRPNVAFYAANVPDAATTCGGNLLGHDVGKFPYDSCGRQPSRDQAPFPRHHPYMLPGLGFGYYEILPQQPLQNTDEYARLGNASCGRGLMENSNGHQLPFSSPASAGNLPTSQVNGGNGFKVCDILSCRKVALFACQCEAAFYCSARCQADHWEKQHENVCTYYSSPK